MNVMESAVRSAFDGKFMGEFGSWLNTITQPAHRRLPRGPQAPSRNHPAPGRARGRGRRLGFDRRRGRSTSCMLGYREIAERLCAERNEIHRAVIKLYGPVEIGYLEYDAGSTAEEINRIHPDEKKPMTATNVYKIWSRFQKDFCRRTRGMQTPRERCHDRPRQTRHTVRHGVRVRRRPRPGQVPGPRRRRRTSRRSRTSSTPTSTGRRPRPGTRAPTPDRRPRPRRTGSSSPSRAKPAAGPNCCRACASERRSSARS